MKIMIKAVAAALAVCAAFYMVLKYWTEISQFFGQLRDTIVSRCTGCSGSRAFADDFDEVDE